MAVSVDAEGSWRWLVSHLTPPIQKGNIAEGTCRKHVEILENLGFPVRKCIGSWYGVKVKYYFKTHVLSRFEEVFSCSFEAAVLYLGEEVGALSRVFALIEDLDEGFSRRTCLSHLRVALLAGKGDLRGACRSFYETGMRGYEAGCAGPQFDKVNQYLGDLGLFEELASEAVLHVVHMRIKDYIRENFAGQ